LANSNRPQALNRPTLTPTRAESLPNSCSYRACRAMQVQCALTCIAQSQGWQARPKARQESYSDPGGEARCIRSDPLQASISRRKRKITPHSYVYYLTNSFVGNYSRGLISLTLWHYAGQGEPSSSPQSLCTDASPYSEIRPRPAHVVLEAARCKVWTANCFVHRAH